MSTVQQLKELRQVLGIGGWCQHEYGPSDFIEAPHCLIGACKLVRGDMYDAISALKHTAFLAGYDVVTAWNDVPDRTVEDVFAFIDRTISRLGGQP